MQSQKGWGGGFLLNKAVRKSPISGVLQLFEGPSRTDTCVFGLDACGGKSPCPLHPHWQRIREDYDRMLRSVAVAELKTVSVP